MEREHGASEATAVALIWEEGAAPSLASLSEAAFILPASQMASPAAHIWPHEGERVDETQTVRAAARDPGCTYSHPEGLYDARSEGSHPDQLERAPRGQAEHWVAGECPR